MRVLLDYDQRRYLDSSTTQGKSRGKCIVASRSVIKAGCFLIASRQVYSWLLISQGWAVSYIFPLWPSSMARDEQSFLGYRI